jgi:hypothetical protein
MLLPIAARVSSHHRDGRRASPGMTRSRAVYALSTSMQLRETLRQTKPEGTKSGGGDWVSGGQLEILSDFGHSNPEIRAGRRPFQRAG